MKSLIALFTIAVFCNAQTIDPTTLNGKVLLGYQGWFRCPGDGAPGGNWGHWARTTPTPESLVIDMYPDLSEFKTSELCALPGFTIGGSPAYLFSAANSQVVDRHFLWMKQYGLDGVLLQRFVSDIAANRRNGDVVLKNVMAAAKKYGRVFAIEYDVSGANTATVAASLQKDWAYLVDTVKVTAQPGYLHHDRKPVVSVWGIGLGDDKHPPSTPAAALELIRWFKTRAGVTYIGGTPAYWRSLSNDASHDPAWATTYQEMNVIQPWTVGRFRDIASADEWNQQRLTPDLAATAENHQLYMPVIFPGFSWHNLNRQSRENSIPRLGGKFLWEQAYNARISGAQMLKIAMFDEVNESTAIFKVAARRQDAPEQGFWLTLDADGDEPGGEALPSDWYLRLAGEITRMFRGEAMPAKEIPSRHLLQRGVLY